MSSTSNGFTQVARRFTLQGLAFIRDNSERDFRGEFGSSFGMTESKLGEIRLRVKVNYRCDKLRAMRAVISGVLGWGWGALQGVTANV